MKNLRLYLGMILLALAGVIVLCGYRMLTPRYLLTEQFVENYMVNPDGTIATYLKEAPSGVPDLAQGREALAESMGLAMQYDLLKNDREKFRQHYEVLERRFLSPQGFVYWKAARQGEGAVSTNALVDDLRIIKVLYAAGEKWDSKEYTAMAGSVGRYINAHMVKGGLLTDFYDARYKNSPDILTLSYLDMEALYRLHSQGVIEGRLAEGSAALLKNLPTDGLFYPQTYQLRQRVFAYADEVNLIDQLLIALQRQQLGISSGALLEFIREELHQQGAVTGKYNRRERTASVTFESPAVYALVVLYSINSGDNRLAFAAYQRMIEFRRMDGVYAGGYMAGEDTHVFDNLYPLLAEFAMYKTYPTYFIIH